MSEEEIELWKEKTKAVFHIIEYRRFWDYINNLQEENEIFKALYEEIIKHFRSIGMEDFANWMQQELKAFFIGSDKE